MAPLLERVSANFAREKRSSIDTWLSDYLIPAVTSFGFGNTNYQVAPGLTQTYGMTKAMEIANSLPGYASAVTRCPPAFAAEMVRASVLSQARFTFRSRPWTSTPRRVFGTRDLGMLESPWPNGTTGDLIGRMEWHAGLAGNAYVTSWSPGRLRVLRPDWVIVVYGSQLEPDDPTHAIDAELVGYLYKNGGFTPQNKHQAISLLPSEVCHWAPLPDPLAAGVGMSWITPAVREMQADVLASQHKINFFQNGATPNLVVKGLPAASREDFNALVDAMEDRHAGVYNAYRTLYLTAGADATVIGSNLSQIDFKATQGTGETRIAALSRVHPVILGLSEGLSGSSLNAGNFSMAKRIWGDTWIYPTLQNLAASLAPLVKVPGDAELWFDVADMPILREDAQDAATIQSTNAATIAALIAAGFTSESAVSAVTGQNMSLLKHTGLVSVQLQEPGATPTAPITPVGGQ